MTEKLQGIGLLFKDLHGALDKSVLIPIKKEIGKRKGFETREYTSLLKYLGKENTDHLYFDPTAILHNLVYLKKFNYLTIHNISVQGLEMMRVKEMIAARNKMFDELEEKKDYESIFMLMDKKLLIPIYKEIFEEIPVKQRYEIFADLHVRSEFGFEIFNTTFLKKVFALRFASKEWQERMEVLKFKTQNASELTIYHGHNFDHNPKDEYSWTLNKHTADFFANRFGSQGKVSKKIIKFEQVIDFYDSRNEAEIILLTKNLK